MAEGLFVSWARVKHRLTGQSKTIGDGSIARVLQMRASPVAVSGRKSSLVLHFPAIFCYRPALVAKMLRLPFLLITESLPRFQDHVRIFMICSTGSDVSKRSNAGELC